MPEILFRAAAILKAAGPEFNALAQELIDRTEKTITVLPTCKELAAWLDLQTLTSWEVLPPQRKSRRVKTHLRALVLDSPWGKVYITHAREEALEGEFMEDYCSEWMCAQCKTISTVREINGPYANKRWLEN